MFLGLPVGVKGYKRWIKESNVFKVITSRDVIFKKDLMPCLSDKLTGTVEEEVDFAEFEVEDLDSNPPNGDEKQT